MYMLSHMWTPHTLLLAKKLRIVNVYTKTNVLIKFGSFLMACPKICSKKDVQFPTLLTCMEFRCKHMLPHVNAICTVSSSRKSADQFNVYTITEWLYYVKGDTDQVSEMLGVTVHCITSTSCVRVMSNRLHVHVPCERDCTQ